MKANILRKAAPLAWILVISSIVTVDGVDARPFRSPAREGGPRETGSPQDSVAECADGIDNDGDGLVDWQQDLGCTDANDTEGSLSYAVKNGWTVAAPSADSRIIYVSSSGGNDSNSGLTPAMAKRTIAAGLALLRSGYPDWLLLKRGDVFSSQSIRFRINGRSPSERLVLSSYGSSIVRPQLVGSNEVISFDSGTRNIFISGLRVSSSVVHPTSETYGIRILGTAQSHIEFQDMYVEKFEENFSIQTYPSNGTRISNIVLRRNVIADAAANYWKAQGIYIQSVDGIDMIENIFEHNGWLAANETPTTPGSSQAPTVGPNIYKHNVYVQGDGGLLDSSSVKFLRNIVTGTDGAQFRSGGIVEDNLFVRNATNLYHSRGGPGDNKIIRNVVLEGRTMFADYPYNRSWGPKIDGGSGLEVIENIVAYDQSTAQYASFAFDFDGNSGVATRNISYKWSPESPLQSGSYGGLTASGNQLNAAVSDPNRRIQHYMAFVGAMPASYDGFVAALRTMQRFNWSPAYMAPAVIDFVRAGFGLSSGMPPVVSLAVVSSRADEASPGSVKGRIRFTRSTSAGNLGIQFSLQGNAVAGVDFVALAGPIVIPDGQTFVEREIVAINDTAVE
ncbi:MAG: hypothetical protein AB7P04_15360, partial [Bacteriovoracia bacterium]